MLWGAGGQHACLIADVLGMNTVLVHPFAGVLSAYGIPCRRGHCVSGRSASTDGLLVRLEAELDELALVSGGSCRNRHRQRSEETGDLHLRYDGSDTALQVPYGNVDEMVAAYERVYRTRFGFTMPGKNVIAATISVETMASLLMLKPCA